MSALLHELEVLSHSLIIHAPTRFSLLGTSYVGSADPRRRSRGDFELTKGARRLLEEQLYRRLHCRQSAEGLFSERVSDWRRARDFLHQLSTADCGTGVWQDGWSAVGRDSDGRLMVERNDLRLWVADGEFRTAAPEGAAGTRGQVRLSNQFRHLYPGFFVTLGNAGPGSGTLVRFYWHLNPQGANLLVAQLTRILNSGGQPFQLKVVSDPLRYNRTDAAVLYVPIETYPDVVGRIREIYPDIAGSLQPATSLFVKRVAGGLGVAEDPGDEFGFGRHRSRLLAAAFATPSAARAPSGPDRFAAVLAFLRKAGFEPERIYLNPRSVDRYASFEEAAAVDL